jgi:ABC-type lipoprotein export system ATPase subunit
MARALVTNPALILADEPTGNLDSKTGADIMALLADLNHDGRTIILVTHDKAVARHAQRVLQMQDGEFVSSI